MDEVVAESKGVSWTKQESRRKSWENRRKKDVVEAVGGRSNRNGVGIFG